MAMPLPRRAFNRLMTSENQKFNTSTLFFCLATKKIQTKKGKKKKKNFRSKNTSEIESFGRRKRNLHEMGMLELTIPRQIVNNRDFSLLELGRFSPNSVPLRAGF